MVAGVDVLMNGSFYSTGLFFNCAIDLIRYLAKTMSEAGCGLGPGLFLSSVICQRMQKTTKQTVIGLQAILWFRAQDRRKNWLCLGWGELGKSGCSRLDRMVSLSSGWEGPAVQENRRAITCFHGWTRRWPALLASSDYSGVSCALGPMERSLLTSSKTLSATWAEGAGGWI